MNGASESDAYAARRTGVSAYLATPDGGLAKFNFPAMHGDILANPAGTFYASDYVTTSP